MCKQALGSTKFGRLVCVTSFLNGDGMSVFFYGTAGQNGPGEEGLRPRRKRGRRPGDQSMLLPRTPCGNDLKEPL